MTDRSKAAATTAEPTVDVDTDPLFIALFAEAEMITAEEEAVVTDLFD